MPSGHSSSRYDYIIVGAGSAAAFSRRASRNAGPPSILFNYLQDPQDRLDLRASVRLTRDAPTIMIAEQVSDLIRGKTVLPKSAAPSGFIRGGKQHNVERIEATP